MVMPIKDEGVKTLRYNEIEKYRNFTFSKEKQNTLAYTKLN